MKEELLCRIKNMGIKTEEDLPLSKYTTFKIGGPADAAFFPKSVMELTELCRMFKAENEKFIVIGNGSNLLFSDAGYRGAVVITSEINDICINGNVIVAGCGASLIKVSILAKDNNLSGLEFAYGIPGTVGGAVYMNAGAYDGEISGVIKSCTVLDTESGEIFDFTNSECDFSYRNSIFEKNGIRYVILEAEFELADGNVDEISSKMEDFMSRRREKQPLEYPSAGSAFKRAPGYFTAKLIDDAGLKGYSVGGAQVSEKHAGFIINRGGATAADVLNLTEHIKKTVLDKFKVEIECEIRIIE